MIVSWCKLARSCEMHPDGPYLAVTCMVLESTHDCSSVSFGVPPIQEVEPEDEETWDDDFQPGVLLVGEGAVPDHFLCIPSKHKHAK